MDSATLTRGFRAGAGASVAMSVPMLIGTLTGLSPMPAPIPLALVQKVQDKGQPKPLLLLAAAGSHLAYGGVWGAVLSALARRTIDATTEPTRAVACPSLRSAERLCPVLATCAVRLWFGWTTNVARTGVCYGTAKAADDRMAACMAYALRAHDVAAVSLYLGLVRTEALPRAAEHFDLSNAESPHFIGRAQERRWRRTRRSCASPGRFSSRWNTGSPISMDGSQRPCAGRRAVAGATIPDSRDSCLNWL